MARTSAVWLRRLDVDDRSEVHPHGARRSVPSNGRGVGIQFRGSDRRGRRDRVAIALRILRRTRSRLGARAGERAPGGERFPSVVEWIHAADWHEREAEDLFGVRFEGHPHLGDFVLHDDAWQEGVEPMRRGFDAQAALRHRLPDADWRPRRIVQEPGAFVMPIGPKFSGVTESVHFLLETVGEDVIRSSTRLFYKWRAVEKLAEGKTVEEVLLLAERFAATTAFAHGLAFCQAVESIGGAEVPARARSAARVSGRTRAAAAARRRDPGNLRIHGAGRRHQSGRNPRGGAAARVGRTHGSSLPVRPARAGRAAVRSADRGLSQGAQPLARHPQAAE